jgi:hypothetical protein
LEAITRLVADSLARHGFDRPVDPRRLQWSRWFRCESPHSLLVVPSKPGIFALAEEVMDLGSSNTLGASNAHVGTAAPGCPAEQSSASASATSAFGSTTAQEAHDFGSEAPVRRMLAVLQFSEDDDMAFTLDRMFTCINPMRSRLSSGRCFLRFVVIEDQAQRRNICNALNQWMLSSAEKASGIPTDFSSSLEMSSVARTPSSATTESTETVAQGFPSAKAAESLPQAPHLDSGANKNLHCPHPLPSGF